MIRGGKEPLSVDDMIREAGDPWPKIKRDMLNALVTGAGPSDEETAEAEAMVGKIPACLATKWPGVGFIDDLNTSVRSFSSYDATTQWVRTGLSMHAADSQAGAAYLAEEHGIQPLVSFMWLSDPSTLDQDTRSRLDHFAERLTDRPSKEAEYQQTLTMALTLSSARRAFHDFSEELDGVTPREQLEAVLRFRNQLLCWLWWVARIVDGYEIDWSAYPMPWELDEEPVS